MIQPSSLQSNPSKEYIFDLKGYLSRGQSHVWGSLADHTRKTLLYDLTNPIPWSRADDPRRISLEMGSLYDSRTYAI